MMAVSRDRAESDRYMGAIFGTVPSHEVFSPYNIQRVIGAGAAAPIA